METLSICNVKRFQSILCFVDPLHWESCNSFKSPKYLESNYSQLSCYCPWLLQILGLAENQNCDSQEAYSAQGRISLWIKILQNNKIRSNIPTARYVSKIVLQMAYHMFAAPVCHHGCHFNVVSKWVREILADLSLLEGALNCNDMNTKYLLLSALVMK